MVETRRIGRAKMYRLNKKNPIIQKLIELDNAISEYYAKKYLQKSEKLIVGNKNVTYVNPVLVLD